MGSPVDHTALNRSTYDRIARRYLERLQGLRRAADHPFGRIQEAFFSALPAEAIVADLGCGPALDGAHFAQRGLRVVAMDLSAGMLATAGRSLAGRLAQADLRALPLAGGRLDGIWCAAALLHVPETDTGAVLREFGRTLSPGGVLALMTALGRDSVSEPVPYAPGEHRWFVYRDEARLVGGVGDAGFRLLSADQIDGNRRWSAILAAKTAS